MQIIKRSRYIFTRNFMAVLLLLMMGITVSYAQDDIETDTYEDKDNGIRFDYPAEWTERSEYEEDSISFVDTFASDDSAGMSVIIADAGDGQTVIDDLEDSLPVVDQIETTEYAGVAFTVYEIETPDFNEGVGYILYTEDLSYDLLIAILANDDMLDDYLEIITDSLVLSEVAVSDTDDKQETFETSTYEDDDNGIRFDYPAEWTEIDEYGDDVSDSVDIITPDESTGVTVIVAESGEGQTILDEIGENITIEDDEATAEYAEVMFTVFEIEVPDFEDEDGDSRFGYLLLTEDLSYDLLIGVITTDGMEDDYLEIIMESLVLPEAEPDEDGQKETDASEIDVDEGLIFAGEFDGDDASDTFSLSVDDSFDELLIEDVIVVDEEDGTSYIQLEADPPDILPYLAALEDVPDAYELQMRLRLADMPFTALEIDVAFSDESPDAYVTVAFNRQDIRISDVIFETSETTLAIESYDVPRDEWIDLRITVDDDEITVFIDDEVVIEAEDATYIGNNFVGIFVSNGIVDVDYIRMFELDD